MSWSVYLLAKCGAEPLTPRRSLWFAAQECGKLMGRQQRRGTIHCWSEKGDRPGPVMATGALYVGFGTWIPALARREFMPGRHDLTRRPWTNCLLALVTLGLLGGATVAMAASPVVLGELFSADG